MRGVRSTIRLGWRYIIGWLGLRSDDVLLVSFPRSGSTWVRFILCNYLSLQELGGREIDFYVLDELMPALGYSNLLPRWPYKTIPRFVKTHQPYRRFVFFRPQRVIYVQRDPRDVMASYYRLRSLPKTDHYSGSFSDFIRDDRYGLRACIQHYLFWRPHTTVRLTYEGLREGTFFEFKKMLEALKIAVDGDVLKLAIERSEFGTIRSVEGRSGFPGSENFHPEFRFTHKGEVRQWTEYFTDSDLVYYHEVCEETRFFEYSEVTV